MWQPACRWQVSLPETSSVPPSYSTKPTRELLSPACLCSSRNWGTHGEAVSFHGNADTFQTRASTNDREPGACWSVAWNGVSLDWASYYSLSFLACLCSEGFIPPLLLDVAAACLPQAGFIPLLLLYSCPSFPHRVHTPNHLKNSASTLNYCFLSQSCFNRARGANRGSVA